MKTRVIRIYWKTWRKVRTLIPAYRSETISDYLERVVRRLEE